MRHVAQEMVLLGEARPKEAAEPSERDLVEAIDDMLFNGGALNVKLLGGEA